MHRPGQTIVHRTAPGTDNGGTDNGGTDNGSLDPAENDAATRIAIPLGPNSEHHARQPELTFASIEADMIEPGVIEPGRALALADFSPPHVSTGERLIRLAYRFGLGPRALNPFGKRVAPRLTHVASLPGDTPLAPENFVARLHAARRAAHADIAVAVSGVRTHHVAALWPVAIAGALRRAVVEDGVRRVERFALQYVVATVEWPAEPLDPFMNVNSPDDLARAEALLRRDVIRPNLNPP